MKLREWRKLKGYSVKKVAQKIGVTDVAIRRYENGTRIPNRLIMSNIVALTSGAVQPNDFFEANENE